MTVTCTAPTTPGTIESPLHGRHVAPSTTNAAPRCCPQCSWLGVEPDEQRGLITCSRCRLVFRPSYLSHAEGEYWTGYLSNAGEQSYDARRKPYYNAFWKRLQRMPRSIRPGRQPSILDVGCVPGNLLAAAASSNWALHGVEMTRALCARTAEQTDAVLWCGHVEDLDFGGRTFDLITMSGMLRHATSPDLVMRTVARLLRPGGAVVVREIDVTHPRHARRAAHPYLFDMQLFSPASLRRLMATNGLIDCTVRHSPVSLLTTGRGTRMARSHPAVYRRLLGMVNGTIHLLDGAIAPRRIMTPAFLAVGYADADSARRVDQLTHENLAEPDSNE